MLFIAISTDWRDVDWLTEFYECGGEDEGPLVAVGGSRPGQVTGAAGHGVEVTVYPVLGLKMGQMVG